MSGSLFDLHNPELAQDFDQQFGQPEAQAAAPDTSRQAARSIDPRQLREIRQNVLQMFRVQGQMTQAELVTRYHLHYGPTTPDSSIRTRCHELVDGGYVKDTGQKKRLPSGRHAVIWAATNKL